MELFAFCTLLAMIFGTIGIIKGFRVLIGFILASIAVTPLLLLLRIMVLNIWQYAAVNNGPPMDIMRVLPKDFWIYLIPACIFIIGTFIYNAIINRRSGDEATQDTDECDYNNRDQ